MSVAALRMRYARFGQEARLATVERLSPIGGFEFQLTEISGRAIAATEHWQSGYYDWYQVLRRYNDPDRLDVALWTSERLLALGVATTRAGALWIELVEGDRDRSTPLSGTRLLILFDAFANYAQLRGKRELRLEAKNAGLAALYENAYGFERVLSKGNALYWARRV
jgi:hypothetical protein